MYLKWITNKDRSSAREERAKMESTLGNTYLIGRPFAQADMYSVTDLESMNMVGIYLKVQDIKGEPDTDCPDCNGTGVILLFRSSVSCECLKKGISIDNPSVLDHDNGYWE